MRKKITQRLAEETRRFTEIFNLLFLWECFLEKSEVGRAFFALHPTSGISDQRRLAYDADYGDVFG